MRFILIGFGVLVFAVSLVTRLPMALAVEKANLPITYDTVSGTIWNGSLRGIEVNGQAVGDLSLRLHALSLLTGQAKANLALQGSGVTGSGVISARGRSVRIQNGAALVALEPLRLRDVFGQRLRGQLDADVRELRVSTQGCQVADFTVTTDALTRSLGAYASGGLDLSGEGRCEGDALVVPLAGSSPEADVEATLRVEPNGQYITQLKVTPKVSELGSFLTGVGFEQDGGAFIAETRGMIAASL